MIFIVGILVAIIIILLIYNITIHKKIQQFNNLSRQANNLRVLQDFLSTIGECSSVDEKIQKINNILYGGEKTDIDAALILDTVKSCKHNQSKAAENEPLPKLYK